MTGPCGAHQIWHVQNAGIMARIDAQVTAMELSHKLTYFVKFPTTKPAGWFQSIGLTARKNCGQSIGLSGRL